MPKVKSSPFPSFSSVNTKRVSSGCTILAIVGAILVIVTHHGESTGFWSNPSVHIGLDIVAVALISSPVIRWFFSDDADFRL